MNPSLVCSVPIVPVFATFSKTPAPTLTPARPVEGRRAIVPLTLVRKDGTPYHQTVDFRIDPGADLTQLSLEMAQNVWGLKVGIDSGYVSRTTATGTASAKAFRGTLRVRFPGCPDEFEFPCLFVECWPSSTPPLLGLDVVNQLRVRFDRTPLATAPHGAVHFERYGP